MGVRTIPTAVVVRVKYRSYNLETFVRPGGGHLREPLESRFIHLQGVTSLKGKYGENYLGEYRE